MYKPKCLTLLLLAALLFATIIADDDDNSESEGESSAEDKVIIETISSPTKGCERKTKRYDHLSMHYVGTLTETGVKFDASYDRNEPFKFQLGAGQVIKGWDEGLLAMCVGEKRKLIIPSSKGYGESGAGQSIPPNAGLTFEVELISIEDGTAPPNVFKEIDSNGDMMLSQPEILEYLQKQSSKLQGAEQDVEQHKEIVAQIFNHEDKDKDGYISHDEFSGPKHDEL